MIASSELLRRFVILHHAAPDGEHWDLMIETGEKLATWRLTQNPCENDNWRAIDAEHIGDHRRLYLDYEGPLSNDRGSVTRVDAGTCQLLANKANRWRFRAVGKRFSGTFELNMTDESGELRRLPEA